jgi:hypothetical protein
VALVDRPTTTTDAGGWSESPDQTPEAPVTAPTRDLSTPDASGATVEAVEAAAEVEATEKTEPPRRPDGRFEKNGFRRRAASQQATAEDVPRIQELTRRLRDAERERDEARGVAPQTPPGTPPAGPPPPQPPPQPPPPAARRMQPLPPFTLPEPTWDQFKDSDDPLRDYTKAMANFTHTEHQYKIATQYQQRQHAQAEAQERQQFKQATEAHWARMQAVAADPANAALVARFKDDARPITPAILAAVVQAGDHSAKLTLALLQREGLLEELTLATYDKPATPDLVALVQRRLATLGPLAATTGSATAPPQKLAPRPPNPVRTAPDAPPRDLPGDDASLADHAAAFHQPRRSRLRRG